MKTRNVLASIIQKILHETNSQLRHSKIGRSNLRYIRLSEVVGYIPAKLGRGRGHTLDKANNQPHSHPHTTFPLKLGG